MREQRQAVFYTRFNWLIARLIVSHGELRRVASLVREIFVLSPACLCVHIQVSRWEERQMEIREEAEVFWQPRHLSPGMPRMPVPVLLGSWGWGFFAIFLLLLATPSPAAIRRGKFWSGVRYNSLFVFSCVHWCFDSGSFGFSFDKMSPGWRNVKIILGNESCEFCENAVDKRNVKNGVFPLSKWM